MRGPRPLSFGAMRARRLVATLAVFATSAMAIAAGVPGCQDATQATLDIRIAKTDLCPKLGGTAIAVGADRDEVEARISSYVTADTRDCDPSTGSIGSLVVTPGEAGRSAIVVAVAFDTARARTAADCKPPAYAGCVVARRFFAFSDHKNLRIPITIDPECLDVPCNATSTCRKGNCYDSTAVDNVEPGDDGFGGASEAGIVDGAVDGFVPDASKPDGSSDGSSEGSVDGGSDAPGDAPLDSSGQEGGFTSGRDYCEGTILVCPAFIDGGAPMTCSGPGQACCNDDGAGFVCRPQANCIAPNRRACCLTSDCGGQSAKCFPAVEADTDGGTRQYGRCALGP